MEFPQLVVHKEKDRLDRIYISGPMTGIDQFNFPAFNSLAARLAFHGWIPVNPADHGLVEGATKTDYLRYDVAALSTCSSIVLMEGWEQSSGARLELGLAVELGLVVYYVPNALHPHVIGATILDV